jgi:hypothetical protein
VIQEIVLEAYADLAGVRWPPHEPLPPKPDAEKAKRETTATPGRYSGIGGMDDMWRSRRESAPARRSRVSAAETECLRVRQQSAPPRL